MPEAIQKYSFVFQPSEEGIQIVKSIKEDLKNKIGWFSSCHALAHMTICECFADESKLYYIKKQLVEVLKYEKSQYVYFEEYAFFPNHGTFYIAPTLKSKQFLKEKMNVITNIDFGTPINKSNEPHLTVARKLDQEKLAIAVQNYKMIDLDFFCASIFLRRFNPIRKQYDIIEEFRFGNVPKPAQEEGQLSFDF
ncbi:2'-5' RNA ligase family protein [Sphingobacterium sp. SRCM116780]|uniref:2'-5' RNA ligase family protein n=1 Tax=Sphingobacterium sp. SRCM116780 TaxID=2907623 RepID=UPI001F3C3721|nr:2'-5' RNA ligase family protein [Sphingobacterium sp. SRCM116780]UIR57061.1 2'-5' RNA ligase family protein [Sphingobacterium sp. SRCM116780]